MVSIVRFEEDTFNVLFFGPLYIYNQGSYFPVYNVSWSLNLSTWVPNEQGLTLNLFSFDFVSQRSVRYFSFFEIGGTKFTACKEFHLALKAFLIIIFLNDLASINMSPLSRNYLFPLSISPFSLNKSSLETFVCAGATLTGNTSKLVFSESICSVRLKMIVVGREARRLNHFHNQVSVDWAKYLWGACLRWVRWT